MFRRIVTFFTCAILVTALGRLPATASGLGFRVSSSYSGTCRQQDCVAAFFVADAFNARIFIFNREAQLIRTMAAPSQTSIIATDSQGRLYVSGNFSGPALLIYSPPLYNTPTKIKVPAGLTAGGIAVDARSGRFAVVSGNGGNSDEIQIYEPNSTTPCATVYSTAFGNTGTFDRDGTLYFFSWTSNGLGIVSIPGGCSAKTAQELTFGQSYRLTNFMQFNADDDLVVQSRVAPSGVAMYTFHHPQNGRFGEPISMTTLENTISGVTYELFNGFASDGRHVWGEGYNSLSLYNYPAGGLPVLVLTGDAFTFCYFAVVPPLKP